VIALPWFATASAQVLSPERHIQGAGLLSERDPAIRIQLPRSAHYVAGDRWKMFDLADCELHVFVSADEKKVIHRLYWIQFEQYLPKRPDLRYEYKDPLMVRIGGKDFFVNTSIGNTSGAPRPGSDNAKVQELLVAAGYSPPAEMISARFVRVLDDTRRRELMLIYSEDTSLAGVTEASVAEGGAQRARWPAISRAFLERAKKAFSSSTFLEP
jgi:hypothetical protein